MKYLNPGPMMPRENVAAAGAEALAMGNLTGDALKAAQDITVKIKKQKEAGEIASLFAQMEEEAAEFSNSLMTRQDPENWVNDFRQMSNGWKTRIGEQAWMPDTKRRVTEQFIGWNSSKMTNLAKQSATRVFEEGKARIGNTLEYAAGRGDRALYSATVEEGRGVFYGDEEAKRLTLEGDRRFQRYEMQEMIEDDPLSAVEMLESDSFLDGHPGLTVDDQSRLLNQAEVKLRRVQREQLSDLDGQVRSQKIITRDELEAELDKTVLSEDMREDVLFNFEQQTPIPIETRTALMDTLNEFHSQLESGDMTIDEYWKAHDGIAQQIYAFGARDGSGGLRQRVYALDPAKWSPGNFGKSTTEESTTKEVQDLVGIYHKQGVFGEVDDEADPLTRADQQARAEEEREKFEKKVMLELQRDPNQSANDAFKKVYFGDKVGTVIGAPQSQGLGEVPKPSRPGGIDRDGFDPEAGDETSMKSGGKYEFLARPVTRDQIKNFKSTPEARVVSLDFNDASNKAARGIEIKIPSDATTQERTMARLYAIRLQAFFAKHGVKVPIRRYGGIKTGGRGVPGVIHTEPFFASNTEARKAIEKDPKGYARVLASTLGRIPGVTFIAPHKQNDPGAVTPDGVNERDFALKTILPHLING